MPGASHSANPAAEPDAHEEFGQDPMDVYSKPVSVQETKLTKLITMPIRAKLEKPGRTLTVMWDERAPIIDGFANRYSYIVRFTQAGGMAGNHYHKKKHELYQAITGQFTVILEDLATKEREEHTLKAGDATFLYVAPGVAHVVISSSDNDVLLVVSATPEVQRDEFPYQVAEAAK